MGIGRSTTTRRERTTLPTATKHYFNLTGASNTATGWRALFKLVIAGGLVSLNKASNNTANGYWALNNNTTGHDNTAVGYSALFNNTTGSNNIAIGPSAGTNLTTGSNNIYIGAYGSASDSSAIRTGRTGLQTSAYITGIHGTTVAAGMAVMVDSSGHLGTLTSSARYKKAIQPLDQASETILDLQPVTFRYKEEIDPEGIPQFGLVAEEVEKVNPDLVARDEQGKPYTVRYEAVNAMLLNEFLKAHRKITEQERTISQLGSTIAAQEMEFRATVAGLDKERASLGQTLKKQAVQLQKIDAQLGTNRPIPLLTSIEQN